MGFVEVFRMDSSEEVSQIWKQYADISKMGGIERGVPLNLKIENGSRVYVGRDQALVLFSGERLVDCCVGPAAYVYHDVFECGKCASPRMRFVVRKEKEDHFCDALMPGEETTCALIRMPECESIPFTFDEATYHDDNYNIDIVLQGGGKFEIGESDPSSTYTHKEYSRERLLSEPFEMEFSEEEKEKLAAEFVQSMKEALAAMRDMSIDYDELAYETDEIINMINTASDSFCDSAWEEKRGIALKRFYFSAIYPDEKSVLAIVRARKAKAAASPAQAPAQASQSTAPAQTSQPTAPAQTSQTTATLINNLPPGYDGPAELILKESGPQKVAVIKVLVRESKAGLKPVKDFVDQAPGVVLKVNRASELTNNHQSLINALQAAGATLEIKAKQE